MNALEKTARRMALIARAKSYLGQQEDAAHSNRGPFVTQCLADVGLEAGEPWYMAFAYRCALETCEAAKIAVGMSALEKTGSCQEQVDHARALGTFVPAKAGPPTPGWLMVEWEPSVNRYGHTGIVETVNGHRFTSIEGNTNTDGGREGYEVARQHRDAGDVCRDGHAKYGFIQTF